MIGVYISNSDALNGFDIQLKTNSSVLKPAGASLSGSIVHSGPGTSISPILCIGGVGPQCGPTDGPDVLDVQAVMLFAFTSNPASGLLFTATYNITGTAPAGGMTIGFQTGCSRSSVTGSSPPVCVITADGTNTPVPETIQAGVKFDNSVQPNWVALTSNVPSLTFLKNLSKNATITATAENGWPFFSIDTVTFSTAPINGLNPGFFSSFSCLTGGTSCSVNVTISATAAGTYSLTVLGTYVFTDPNTFQTDTLVAPVTIQVNVQDVTIRLNPSGSLYMFGTLPVAATVQAFGGYAGTVTLSTQIVSPATGIAFQYPALFSLGVNGAVTKTVNITSTSFNRYLYQMKMSITGSGCAPVCSGPSITHASFTEAFLVSGFKLTPNSTNTSFIAGGSHSLTVVAQSIGGSTTSNDFAGTIKLNSTSTPTGLSVTESLPFVTLAAGSSSAFTVNFSSATPGTYTAHVTGTGGANIANETATMTITVLATITFQSSMIFAGVNSTITGSLVVSRTSNTLSGSTILNVVNATSGAPIYSKTTNVNMTFTQFGMSHFIEDVPTSPLWLGTNCVVSVNAASVSCFLSRTPDVFHGGGVTINEVTYVVSHYGSSDAVANLSATGQVNINDFGIMVQYYGAAVFLP